MNTGYEDDILANAIEACAKRSGLSLTGYEQPTGSDRTDALLRLRLPEGQAWAVCVEVRAQLRPWMIPHLLAMQTEALEKGRCDAFMISAPYIPEPLAERLRSEKLWFMDTAGNAYLDVPDRLLVFTVGRRPQKLLAPKRERISAEGAKVLFFLLVEGPEVRATYRDISREVGVSLGLVSRVMAQLMRRGVITRRGEGGYAVQDARRLLERWCLAYEEELRPKLLLGRYRAPDGTEFAALVQRLPAVRAQRGPLVGGEYAGDLLTGHLRPASLSLHVPRDQAGSVRQRLRLAPSEEGNIELYELFSAKGTVYLGDSEPATVHPVLVYAELLAAGDARAGGTASRLKEEYLSWIP